MNITRPACYEIPSEHIALHFSRKALALLEERIRPRICAAEGCLTIIEPWLAYEAGEVGGPRDRRPDLCRACADELA